MENPEEIRDQIEEIRNQANKQIKKLKNNILINQIILGFLFLFLIGVVILMISMTNTMMGEKIADTIKTYNLQIMKKGTNEPAIWMGEVAGGYFMYFYDAESDTIRVTLGSARNYPKLQLSDDNGKAGIALSVLSNDPSLSIWDSREKERLKLSVSSGKPHIYLYDGNDKNRVYLGFLADNPAMIFSDKYGKERIGVRVAENASALSFKNDEGQVKAGMGLRNTGEGYRYP